ncbi:MAG: universal stress protein [Aestuariivirga sp.]
MGYKTISVSLNDISENTKLLEITAGIARKFRAHVNGIYVIPAPQVYPNGGADIVPVIMDYNQVYFRDRAKKVQSDFTARMKADDLTHTFVQIGSSFSSISDDMIRAGQISDLVICSAVDDQTTTGIESDFVESLIISTGRPLLVIPKQFNTAVNFDKIVVGWNDSHESARAVFDALPVLKLASEVHFTVVDPQKMDDRNAKWAGADISETMARHGIKSIADSYPTNGGDPGSALLEHARDLGAGLIVMGAYGHSRLREFILGGATRTILAEMDIPVLLSH